MTVAPHRLLMSAPARDGRCFVTEIIPGADGSRVSVTCWENNVQQGEAIEIPLAKAPQLRALVARVEQALAELQEKQQ